jgi:hypothetical protein
MEGSPLRVYMSGILPNDHLQSGWLVVPLLKGT